MNNSFTKSISYLTEEETAQFNELMSLNFPEYKYFDLKIDPKLTPKRNCGENAFEWVFDWDIEIGILEEKLTKEFLPEKKITAIQPTIEKIGWGLIQDLKKAVPVPWSGCSYFLSKYEGHPSWKYVENHPNKQGYSYSYSVGLESKREIVGILQVKDADLIIEEVVKKALGVVDWLIILDNKSSDETFKKLKEIEITNSRIILKSILTVEAGGRQLNCLCGTDSIVVRIDADEIWSNKNTEDLKQELRSIDLSKECRVCVRDGMIHVNGADLNNEVCVGKNQDVDFYYFGNILAWSQSSERMHGRPITLRPQCDIKRKFALNFKTEKDESLVLHLPFFNLSSKNKEDFRPGWEGHKKSYIEKDSDKWQISYLSNFNSNVSIKSTLLEIIKSEVWSVSETHPHLFY